MEVSKIHLSPAELQLFCNAEIILTKNSIVKKTMLLLEDVQQMMLNEKKDDEIFSVSPKISKGENYQGLPYVILDFPRKTDGESIFFVRSMFWWGHFFSSTLHISGRFKEEYKEKLKSSFDEIKKMDFHIGINDDPWLHHFEENNYRKIQDITKEEFEMLIQQQRHIKIAAKWPLGRWPEATALLYDSWKFLVTLITQAVK